MEIYTQTPSPPNKVCRLLTIALALFLSYGAYLFAVVAWWFYNWYYALSAFLLAFILIGILRSKLLHAFIPRVQQEFTYSDKDIAAWYLHMTLCSEAE